MRNWKFFIGKTISEIDELIVRSRFKFINTHYPYGRNWILDVKRILKKEPQIVIDAGANIGSVTNELNYFFPDSEIFAFEPVKDTFDKLVYNTKNEPKIHAQRLALGAVNENLKIILKSENTINSLKIKSTGNDLITEEITVIRLDNFLIKNNFAHIDILKIDVEGFEFEVLTGCGNVEIDCIFLEVGYDREPTKVYFVDVDIYMEKSGYQLCGIYDIMRNLNNKNKLSYSNNLYIKKNLL